MSAFVNYKFISEAVLKCEWNLVANIRISHLLHIQHKYLNGFSLSCKSKLDIFNVEISRLSEYPLKNNLNLVEFVTNLSTFSSQKHFNV